MPTALKYPTSKNAVQKTLDAQLLSGATTSMTLNSVVGIQNKAGVCVIDRVDANGTATPTKREYIIFTGVSGSTLTGLTRNADGGGSDQDHAVGAIVEFVSDVLQEQAILDGLLNVIDTTGALDTTKVVDLTTSQTLTNKVLTSPTITTKVEPTTNDGAALGSTAKQFSDLFLAEGGVINWDNGDATLTQVGDVVTLAGADLKITTPGTASTSVSTIDGTQTLTNKTLTSPKINEDVALTATATQLNSLVGAWTDYTPTLSRSGGAYANAPTLNSARYIVQGKLCTVVVNYTLHATPGSSGIMTVTCPSGKNPAVTTAVTCFDGNSGKALTGIAVTSGTISLYLYDGNIEATASHSYYVYASYEIA